MWHRWCVCVWVAAALLGSWGTAQATGMMLARPYLVDAKCNPIKEGARVSAIWVTGSTRWATSPPGGPVSYGGRPIKQTSLRVIAGRCEHPEKPRFKRDGTCKGQPRYRWVGVARPGIVYRIMEANGQIGLVGVSNPERTHTCPAPPPPPFDKWTDIAPTKTFEATIARDKISVSGNPNMPLIDVQFPELAKHTEHFTSFGIRAYTASGWTAEKVLGVGDGDVVFEVKVIRKRHRYEMLQVGQTRDTLFCHDDIEETVELRRPGVPTVWTLKATKAKKPVRGKCR